MAASGKQIHGSSLSLPRSSSSTVFLSFRDLDTCQSFVDHLYEALRSDRIQTFSYHSKLKRELGISSEIGEVIAKSKVSIVILSKHYAGSEWCLDELVEILKFKRTRGQEVIPIFYDVDPLQVRHQIGEFGTAFAQLKDNNKVKAWKVALTDVSYCSGWELQNLEHWSHANFISDIVKKVALEIEKAVVFQGTITNLKVKIAGVGEDKFRSLFETVEQVIPSTMFPQSPTKSELIPSPLRSESHPSSGLKIFGTMSSSGQSLHLYDLEDSATFTPPKNISMLGPFLSMELFRWSTTTPYNKSDGHSKLNHWRKKIYGLRNYCDSGVLLNPRFDVFLSFTKEDNDLGRELNRGLVHAGIKTFISPFGYINEQVVNKSRIVMIVLSENMLSSRYRLNDLARLMDHKMMLGQFVIPVFYNKSPVEFRYPKRKNSEGKISNYHAEYHKEGRWRTALKKAALFPGYYLKMIADEEDKKYFGSYSTRHEVRSNESYVPHKNEKKSRIYYDRMVKRIVSEVHRKVSDMARDLVVRVPHRSRGIDQWLIYGAFDTDGHKVDEISLYGNLQTCLINDMNFTGMKKARTTSIVMSSQSLKILDVSYTRSLVRSPPFSAIQNLEILILRGCINLVEISQSIKMVKRLSLLDIRDCKSLANFPKNISTLRFLETLNLSGCSSLREIPTGLNNLESLKEFHADGVAILALLTSHQTYMMELEMDFPKRSGTMSDTRKLFGQIGKAQLEYEILSQKFVTTLHLKVINLAANKLSEFPNNLNCPSLEKLYLQSNPDLRDIPSSFFERMPVLKVLDMSNTSIKSLSPSASKLLRLEELVLRGCELLIELPHEIGELKSLKILDLEGTDLVCLPKELSELTKLEFLNISLYDAASYRINKEIVAIIPSSILSTLTQLKELNIHVNPHDVWWNDAIRTIFKDLPSLGKLKSLKLYVPTTELLEDFLKLEWNKDTRCIYQSLSHFCFIVGTQAPHIISRVPHVLEEEFLKFGRCIKHINGNDNIIQLAEALKHANGLYLDRHWTITKLSVFKLDELHELKFCLLVDCNEMRSVFDGSDFYRGVDKGDNVLSLRYLGIFYQKNLEFIWKGPLDGSCLSCLKVLAVHMCPNLTVVFTPILLQYLVNLTEIIIEDCPKIKTLVTLDSFELTSQQFLPRLKKLSLLNLPELVNISSGFQLGPRLETMVIYDCPKLRRLSCAEVCNNQIKEIKGENEWWKSLEWHETRFSGGQPGYLSCAYSQLDIEKDLLDESAPLYGIYVPL